MPPSEFVFVSADRRGRPKATDRKLIRKHCMQGKGSQAATKSASTRSATNRADPPELGQPLVLRWSLPQLKRRVRWSPAKYPVDSTEEMDEVIPDPHPIPSLVTFADELDSKSMGLLFTVLPPANRAISMAGFGLPANIKPCAWREWLMSDLAFVNSTIAFCSVIQDFLLRDNRTSETTSLHLRKAIAHLNRTLSDEEHAVSDTTFATVSSLGLASVICNDHPAMLAHSNGMREMVRVRGGIDGFRGKPQMPVVISRVDLCLALGSGVQPILADIYAFPPSSLGLTPDGRTPSVYTGQSIEGLVDQRLAEIFDSLQCLAQCTNEAVSQRGQKMLESELHAGIWDAQYRLLHLQGTIGSTLGECVRMAMLGFLSTMFRPLGSRLRYEYAANSFKDLYCTIEASTQRERHLRFWMLTIGTIAFFEPEEQWLRERWHSDVAPLTEGSEWADVRQQLRSFLWIELCHDVPGKHIFDKLRSVAADRGTANQSGCYSSPS